MNEWQLIERCFAHAAGGEDAGVIVGIGDDAAVLAGRSLPVALTADTLVEGRHFNAGADARDVGHKALAVSLSDLAAVGAAPRWALLCLGLPGGGTEEEDWVAGFARGFLALARRWKVVLVGGDLVRGPRVVTVQAGGCVERPLRRSGARAGDGIYLTGTVGDAGLAWRRSGVPLPPSVAGRCAARLDRPEPRVREGTIIARFASAAIDVSDGLLLDLFRLAEASRRAAWVDIDKVPIGDASRALCRAPGDWSLPLTGGEDYELLFTMDDGNRPALERALADEADCAAVTRIGHVADEGGERLRCTFEGARWPLPEPLGFDHFGGSP